MTEGCTRSEDAIYRIWSFCKIFGCDRGRDNDLKGQTDWLKGGILAHQKGCAATLSFSPEFEMDDILLNAPDHFAAGNGSGLSAEQLYDMSEIWECLYALMQPYEGETSKAQSTGVFRHTGGNFMDPMIQASVVEEWIAYILSLGPSVVLELARFQDASDAGFDFAQLNDWTDWAPLQSGMTRRRFFREPVAQLYEERLLATTAVMQTKDVTKTLLRKRQTAEMNLAYRQMSMSNKKNKIVPCTLYRRDSALAPEVHRKSSSSSPTTPSSPRPFSPDTAHGGRVQPKSWSPRKVSPTIEDRVDTFNRLSMLSFEGMAEDTSGLAIGRIMDIGFSNAQAKEALRITDMGNGLRVDRAVDWLLRQDRF
ncbi:MAG: UreD-domain-containing protein [Aureobasidium pullulans]|nr:MAG: UreD-domain-containing protein [Aureobasidium pullulans]